MRLCPADRREWISAEDTIAAFGANWPTITQV
jgi:hypothetical protein